MISSAEAVEILELHFAAFHKVAHDAWDAYLEIPEKSRMGLSKRSRASIVHDYMILEAAKYADSADGIKLFNLKMLYGLVIDNVAIRFKKFNELNLSSNNLTAQVKNFRNQLQIEGIPAICHLEVGYSLDDHEKEISQVTLACPGGVRSNIWEMELNGAEAIPLVENIFDSIKKDDIKPSIIKSKKKGEVIPIGIASGEQKDGNDDK